MRNIDPSICIAQAMFLVEPMHVIDGTLGVLREDFDGVAHVQSKRAEVLGRG